MVKPINAYVTQRQISWYGHVMRRDDTNVAREVTTMTVGVKRRRGRSRLRCMDGQSAERYERTPARFKARTEPINMEEGSHGDRPRKGIRSAKVIISYHQSYALSIYLASHIQMFVPISFQNRR